MKVTIGIDNGSNMEILSGLNEGDDVVFAMSGGPVKAPVASSGRMFQRP